MIAGVDPDQGMKEGIHWHWGNIDQERLAVKTRVEGFEGIAQMGGKTAQDAGSRHIHVVLTDSGSAALGYPRTRYQRHWAPVDLSQEEASLVFVACVSDEHGCRWDQCCRLVEEWAWRSRMGSSATGLWMWSQETTSPTVIAHVLGEDELHSDPCRRRGTDPPGEYQPVRSLNGQETQQSAVRVFVEVGPHWDPCHHHEEPVVKQVGCWALATTFSALAWACETSKGILYTC